MKTRTELRPHALCPHARARRLAWAGLVSATLLIAPAWAGSDRDQDRARAAVQAGEVMPLPALLEQVQRSHPGQVLELELEHEDGRWIYEIKLLGSDGQLMKLDVDARSAEVLKVKRKDSKDRKDKRATSQPRQ